MSFADALFILYVFPFLPVIGARARVPLRTA